MALGYLQVGQAVSTQDEDNFQASIAPINTPPVPGGKLRVANIPIGAVALASVGTNTADVAGQLWITDLFVPYRRSVTKVGVLQGGTATTDNILVAIYNSQGILIANSAVAGVTLSGANTFVEIALTATITLHGPMQYFVAVQGNGTAVGAIQTVPAPYIDVVSNTVAGTFGTIPASIAPPTTFTAGKAPVVYVL